MAEGFARHYGTGLLEVASAGLAPTPIIVPETVQVMVERDVDIRSQYPKPFAPAEADTFHYVINLSGFELPPLVHARIIEWRVQDPFGKSMEKHREARDLIEKNVKKLVAEIDRFGVITAEPNGPPIAPSSTRRLGLWQRFTKRR